jgi:type II secretory pathway pseudopilin PulG
MSKIDIAVCCITVIIVAAIAIPNLYQGIVRSRSPRNRTVSDMLTIGKALERYRVDTGQFPILLEGRLRDIVFAKSHEKGLTNNDYTGAWKDAWKEPFYYSGTQAGYTLKSFGQDRRAGSSGGEFDSDIVYSNGSFIAPSALVSP